MEKYLPKDLINIIDEYSKDRTNYDKVMTQLESSIINGIQSMCWGGIGINNFFCNNERRGQCCNCEFTDTFKELKQAGNCFESHMITLDEILSNNKYYDEFIIESRICSSDYAYNNKNKL